MFNLTDNQIRDFLKDKKDYGCAITYSFTLTSVVKVTYNNDTIDITEYEYW